MKKYSLLPIVATAIIFISCGKHMYVVSNRELARLAKNAREENFNAFVVNLSDYRIPDTIKGNVLDWEKKKGKKTWKLDGKVTNVTWAKCYQDNYAYYFYNHVRILKGKLNIFYSQSLTETVTHMNQLGNTKTSFFMGDGEYILPVTYSLLTERMKSCTPAIKKIEAEFGSTWGKAKYQKENINDYRALIRIFTIYNSCD